MSAAKLGRNPSQPDCNITSAVLARLVSYVGHSKGHLTIHSAIVVRSHEVQGPGRSP